MRDRIRAAICYTLSALLFAATLLGSIIWAGSLLARRGLGVWATAQGRRAWGGFAIASV